MFGTGVRDRVRVSVRVRDRVRDRVRVRSVFRVRVRVIRYQFGLGSGKKSVRVSPKVETSPKG